MQRTDILSSQTLILKDKFQILAIKLKEDSDVIYLLTIFTIPKLNLLPKIWEKEKRANWRLFPNVNRRHLQKHFQ